MRRVATGVGMLLGLAVAIAAAQGPAVAQSSPAIGSRCWPRSSASSTRLTPSRTSGRTVRHGPVTTRSSSFLEVSKGWRSATLVSAFASLIDSDTTASSRDIGEPR